MPLGDGPGHRVDGLLLVGDVGGEDERPPAVAPMPLLAPVTSTTVPVSCSAIDASRVCQRTG
ncbi:hypothetical protein [Frankia gtarii]|uniref:hypothetical protein n=1 Tax=Frankia gtarii TaxID=2950102 RepID=UPI0021BE7F74|nr:hypothetical protein [Frankia gtarii]